MNTPSDYADLTIEELNAACTCDLDNADEHSPMCAACAVLGALAAGIPRSVIAGRTKLSDHYSREYIEEMSGGGKRRAGGDE